MANASLAFLVGHSMALFACHLRRPYGDLGERKPPSIGDFFLGKVLRKKKKYDKGTDKERAQTASKTLTTPQLTLQGGSRGGCCRLLLGHKLHIKTAPTPTFAARFISLKPLSDLT